MWPIDISGLGFNILQGGGGSPLFSFEWGKVDDNTLQMVEVARNTPQGFLGSPQIELMSKMVNMVEVRRTIPGQVLYSEKGLFCPSDHMGWRTPTDSCCT